MVTAIIILALVALAVGLSTYRPSPTYVAPEPLERDRERLLAELRAMPGYRPDVRMP